MYYICKKCGHEFNRRKIIEGKGVSPCCDADYYIEEQEFD